jgi:large subunit ribosomal protein L25
VSETALVVSTREGTGKGAARKLRAAGRIPAVLYGRGRASLPVALDPRTLERILRAGGLNTLLDISVEGRADLGPTVALVKELQRDPLRGVITHADLYQVDLSRTIEVDVPIHLVGKPKGIDMGGVLDHTLREVRVECLPRAIPEAIELDVSSMDINDVLHVRDLPLPADVKLMTDPDLGVAHVAVPAAEEVPAPAEAVAAAEVPVEGETPVAAAEGTETKEKGKDREKEKE